MNKNLILCACGAFMSALFTGCKDTDLYQDPTPQIKQEIENSFDFNAMVECPVTFSVGYKTLVSVYADDPDATENPRKLYAAYTDYDGTFSGTMVFPGEFMGKTVYAKYFQTCLKSVVTAEGVTFADPTVKVTRSTAEGENQQGLCLRLKEKYFNLLPEGDAPGTDKNSQVLREKFGVSDLKDMEDAKIKITKDGTKLNASFVHSGAIGVSSRLYYYYYKSNIKEPWNQDGKQTWSEVNTLFGKGNPKYMLFGNQRNGIINQYWSNTVKEGEDVNQNENHLIGTESKILFYGENYDQQGTEEFPAGYTVSFFIRAVDNNGNEKDLGTLHGTRPLYSENWINWHCFGGDNWQGNFVQAAMFKDEGASSLVIGFEDLPVNNGDCDHDYNDIIFLIETDLKNIDKDDIPDLVETPEEEEKEPGIETTEGTLLYEDLFPNEGDYDMNDVIIKYKYTKKFDKNNNIVGGIDYEFTPVTPEGSADYVSGFSLMIDDVMEAPREIFQNHKLVNRQTFTGTITDNVVGYPKDKVKWDDFNPFIRVADTGREVHLTKKKPSPSANLDGLNEYQRNYVTGKEFPFAMNIPYVDYKPVTERVRIDEEYPLYKEWVSSKGKECTNWYLYHTPFEK